jgi:uncharacterized membrane protein HdeD (DUF308 family)
MRDPTAKKGWIATGLVLIGIGVDRLLNAYLLDRLSGSSMSLLSGVLSAAVGSVVLGLAVYMHTRSRNDGHP